jgi:nitroimidazol reductase NimA-like FMN-containing flavoprotein (pyridoxamine 5'-phosphate oxidase superfamily)
MDEDLIPRTPRTTLRRLPARGVQDRALIYAILDQALVCHVGFVQDGQPLVIPTIHVRLGEELFVHGSPASRMLKALGQTVEVCVTVTLVDGLVLARSAFHHSMNYRSVMVFGQARVVATSEEKLRVLQGLSEHLVRGRWQDVRQPSPAELNATQVLALPITEASAKVRTGPPLDDADDLSWPVWAGVLPLGLTAGDPVPDPALSANIAPPGYATSYPGPGPAT